MCRFNNKSNDLHKIININDEDSLEESNISYKKSVEEFKNIFEKTESLNNKIRREISEISIQHRNIIKKINKTFNKYRHDINRRQKTLKFELNSKVEKAKDELESFLNESQRIISSYKNIAEAIKIFGEESNNSIIKTLSYISEIKKSNLKADIFLKKPKCTLLFSFHQENDKIDYKNYFFSGLPSPDDINVEINENNELVISWKIDKTKINDNDLDKIQYFIEIKRHNYFYCKKEFNYSETEITLINFENNCDYQVKIRACLNNISSSWSDVKKFKTDKSLKKFSLFGKSLFSSNDEDKFL